MSNARLSIGSLAITGLVALAFSVAPVGLDYNFSPEIESAFAKGKGSGKSGGKGGGKRGGKSGGGSSGGDGFEVTGDDHEDSPGKSGNGHLKAKGNGHQKNHADAEGDHDGDGDHPNSHGKLASALGNLNAAHASPTALENASGSSIVGLLAAYAEAVNSDEGLTEDEARLALGEISNKSEFDDELGGDAVDAEVVAEVDRLLGLNQPDEDADGEEEEL